MEPFLLHRIPLFRLPGSGGIIIFPLLHIRHIINRPASLQTAGYPGFGQRLLQLAVMAVDDPVERLFLIGILLFRPGEVADRGGGVIAGKGRHIAGGLKVVPSGLPRGGLCRIAGFDLIDVLFLQLDELFLGCDGTGIFQQ